MKQIKISLNTPYSEQNEDVKTKLCKQDFNEIVHLYNLKKRIKKIKKSVDII